MLRVPNVPRAPDALTVVWIPACAGMTAERDEYASENNIVIPGEPSCETREPLVECNLAVLGPGSPLRSGRDDKGRAGAVVLGIATPTVMPTKVGTQTSFNKFGGCCGFRTRRAHRMR
ncbi:hypothetical protein [Hyphomicrobium sp. 99]|uniref:hypothetical protein n=1 Tax=Hyphomicrobium sp. 99 TaxID=1163419 RepID=UPI0005F851BD|nr:hypothetical protein [Hyphomicrobium sp. 99]